MKDIGYIISKSIKESKWIKIKYENSEKKQTDYWCAIKDIFIDDKKFLIDSFNQSKMTDKNDGVLISAKIYFDRILEADIIEGTKYEPQTQLIEKINDNISDLEWLSFDQYNEAVLDYTKACLIYDQAPYQEASTLVPSIDEDTFRDTNSIKLNLIQIHALTKGLEKINKQLKKEVHEEVELAINICSIHTKKGMFVVAYKQLLFNPVEQTLNVDDTIRFNYEFCTKEGKAYRHNIQHYLDIDSEYFIEIFSKDRNKALHMLQKTLRDKEALETKPFIMDLKRQFTINYDKEFNAIKQAKNNNELTTPLKAFFGNMSTSLLSRKRNIQLFSVDERLNIDQLRVMYNAMKQPITYVQGPPGTGKTHSIINLLISSLMTNQKVLVSSNNNKPIDDIHDKFKELKYKNKTIPVPVLRLGNIEHIKWSLNHLKEQLSKYEREFKYVDENKIKDKLRLSSEKYKELNKILNDYEQRIELEEHLDISQTLLNTFKDTMKYIVLKDNHDKILNELNQLPVYKDEDISDFVLKADRNLLMGMYYSSLDRLMKLQSEKYLELFEIINIPNEDDKVKRFNKYIKDDKKLSLLLDIFPIILTTNLSAPRLGSPKAHFDLTIIDEASQCSIGSALFPMIRGKRLLLVGDPNQLAPVVILNKQLNEKLLSNYKVSQIYSYVDNSIIKAMTNIDIVSKFILLRYHYRCSPKIIDFSNKKYYGNHLIIETKENNNQSLLYLNAEDIKKSKPTPNVSDSEATAIVSDIRKKGNYQNVGVITPFRNQVENIKSVFNEQNINDIQIGTIHTFQGDEKDIIYLSACVTPNLNKRTFDWLKNNKELINVAMTRAKKTFVLVGDLNAVLNKSKKQRNDILDLFEYVLSNGEQISITEEEQQAIVNSSNFKNFNSDAERELLNTLSHFLTTADEYLVRREVSVAQILTRFSSDSLKSYGLQSHFDFVLFKKTFKGEVPVLVIELNGPEHYNDEKVKIRDEKKREICKVNNIKLFTINNDYARRYDFVKRSLIQMLN